MIGRKKDSENGETVAGTSPVRHRFRDQEPSVSIVSGSRKPSELAFLAVIESPLTVGI